MTLDIHQLKWEYDDNILDGLVDIIYDLKLDMIVVIYLPVIQHGYGPMDYCLFTSDIH